MFVSSLLGLLTHICQDLKEEKKTNREGLSYPNPNFRSFVDNNDDLCRCLDMFWQKLCDYCRRMLANDHRCLALSFWPRRVTLNYSARVSSTIQHAERRFWLHDAAPRSTELVTDDLQYFIGGMMPKSANPVQQNPHRDRNSAVSRRLAQRTEMLNKSFLPYVTDLGLTLVTLRRRASCVSKSPRTTKNRTAPVFTVSGTDT